MDKSIGNFIFHETEIDDVYIIDMKRYGDERGFFMENYKRDVFEEAGLFYDFVQDNHSRSGKGVLRGLHFQKNHPQAKLVHVLRGEVFSTAVDLRKGSATYGKSVCVPLSDKNHRQLLVPRGFAFGFMVMSDQADLIYKCDDFYHPEDEGGIIWNDPELAIPWPDDQPVLSEKDQKNPFLAECGIQFDLREGVRT